MERVGSIEDLFTEEYDRLVGALGVAFEPEAAADAVQEAFIAADRRWSRVSKLEDPAGWIRRVALNRLRTGRRLGRRRREILATLRTTPPDDMTAELVDLQAAVDALPDRQRMAVCLFHLADLSIDDVAAALRVSPGTVKSNLHDARRALRAQSEEVHDG